MIMIFMDFGVMLVVDWNLRIRRLEGRNHDQGGRTSAKMNAALSAHAGRGVAVAYASQARGYWNEEAGKQKGNALPTT